jgi:DNA-binding response OmpR family regulator
MTIRDILVVEDDEAIATGLSLNLKLAGHTPTVIKDGQSAIAALHRDRFDLVLLDINLPRKSGLEVLEELRASGNLVPVIVLSARDGEYDKVAALRLGADDYVTKPFALAELLARVEAVLRRTQGAAAAAATASPIRFADVNIDRGRREVTRAGAAVKLTHLEYELLVFFATHPHEVLSREQLLATVWGQSAGTPRTIDNFVGQLRKLLEVDADAPRHFITIRGTGYRFDP